MTKNQGYLCMSEKGQLPKEDRGYLARTLHCAVSEVGQVKGAERWDYWLEDKTGLTGAELDLLKEKGLTVLLGPGQDKTVEWQGKDNVISMGPHP